LSTRVAFSWPSRSATATTDSPAASSTEAKCWRRWWLVVPIGSPVLRRRGRKREPHSAHAGTAPLGVVNQEPSSAGGNAARWEARASATTPGSGTVRRERGVFGTVRRFPSGLVCHSTRTVRRRKSTSWTRRASNSATRSPRPAWVITMARHRAGHRLRQFRHGSTFSVAARRRIRMAPIGVELNFYRAGQQPVALECVGQLLLHAGRRGVELSSARRVGF
jgi:hypothetical protein